MTHELNTDQFIPAAGNRLDAQRGTGGRARTVVTVLFSIVVLGVTSPIGPAATAATRPGATALWTITDGCVETRISAEAR